MELYWCMGAANNCTCYCQLYRLVPVYFTPVQLSIFIGKLLFGKFKLSVICIMAANIVRAYNMYMLNNKCMLPWCWYTCITHIIHV